MPSPNNSNPNSPKIASDSSPTKFAAKFSSSDVLPPPPLNQAIGGHGLITPKQRSLLEASKNSLTTSTTTNNLATGSTRNNESVPTTTKPNINVGIKQLPSLTDDINSDNDGSEGESGGDDTSEDESKSEGSDLFDSDADENEEEPESGSPTSKATTNDIKEKSCNQENEIENINEKLEDFSDEEEDDESIENESYSSSDDDIYEGKKNRDNLLKTKYPTNSPNKSKNESLSSETVTLTANSDKLLTQLEERKNILPTPSDVLQAHLREGKEFERNRALANSRAKTPSKSTNSINNNLLDSPPKKDELSPKPILSGIIILFIIFNFFYQFYY
jgi:hypothetical protein